MVKIVDYGSYIIDIAEAMLEHKRGLTNAQLSHLDVIRGSTVQFVTRCIQHEKAPLDRLYKFLDVEAKESIMMVIRYSDHLNSDDHLHPTFREAVSQMLDCAIEIRSEITQMKNDLVQFMEKIGMSVPKAQVPAQKKRQTIQRIQPKQQQQPVNADYMRNAPLPKTPEPQRQPLQQRQARPQQPNRIRRVQTMPQQRPMGRPVQKSQ